MTTLAEAAGRRLASELRRVHVQGIGLDVCDTLSKTGIARHRRMEQLFGKPDALTPAERMAKYGYVQNVPGKWQDDPQAQAWMNRAAGSAHEHRHLDVVDGAQEGVAAIAHEFPVVSYITSRPERLRVTTKKWLERNSFPRAPMMLRPPEVGGYDNSNDWKPEYLVAAYPGVIAYVDDQQGMLNHLPENYPGTIFIIGKDPLQVEHPAALRTETWDDIVQAILVDRVLDRHLQPQLSLG